MSERERWIVYPLLFLALGAALRDKLFNRTTSKSIVCQELVVVDEPPLGQEPVLLAKIGRTERPPGARPSGYVVVNGQVVVEGHLGVDGPVVVNGAVIARQYGFQAPPLPPAVQMLPGMPLPPPLRALQEATQQQSAPRPTPEAPLADPAKKP